MVWVVGTRLTGLGLAVLVAAACSRSQQPGMQECAVPDLPDADSAVYRLFMVGAEPPWQLDSLLYDAIRSQPHAPDLKPVLRSAAAEYGVQVVARSLLQRIAHNGLPPYSVSARDRGNAAAAYGTLHDMYPEAVPPEVLAGLLLNPWYPDELREGLAIATRYVRGDVPELTAALSLTFCQAAFHLRPFAERPSDIELGVPDDRLEWHYAAVRLLEAVVQALAVRPDGPAAIDELLVDEPNPVLARVVRKWSESATPLHAR